MMNRLKYFAVLSFLMLAACVNNDTVRIRGTLSGLDKKTVYLDLISTNNRNVVDSAVTDGKGRFDFKIKLKQNHPAFYNIRYKRQTITLLVSGGEKIQIKSLGNISNNYIIEGSEGSERVKELNSLMIAARNSMDSLSRLFNSIPETERDQRLAVLGEYSNVYVRQKREMITFIIKNATSLSSIYALYQQLPSGQSVFSDVDDILYYKLVADSLSTRYPKSAHVISLKKDVDQMQSRREIGDMLRAGTSDVAFPDINLPDMYGNKVRLSSIKGKVVLLDFWMAAAGESKLDNAELAELYKNFSCKGFEVYQVSLDESKSTWITAVQEQKIPWISVCDFSGGNSPAAHLYGVTALPANFLFDKDGRIIGKNLSRDMLEAKLKELL